MLRAAFEGRPVAQSVAAELLDIGRFGLPEDSTEPTEEAQLAPCQATGSHGYAGSQISALPVGDVEAAEILAAGLDSNWQEEDLRAFFRMMDSRHGIITLGNRVAISERRQDGSVSLHAERDLKLKYRPFYREVVGERGGVSRTALFDMWLRSPSRPEYSDGLTFAPGGCGPRQLNLWTGWAVSPDPLASCSLILAHIRDVICGGDVDAERYVLGWLAHLVQFPGEKPGVGIVLRGAKGTGKDTLGDYLAKMIGHRHAPTIGEEDHLVGKFNARLEAALLLHVQEASWAGNRRSESTLKYLVTSEWIEVEHKGIDSYQVRSVLRLLLTANADWVVPASVDERRWCVLEVSDAHKQDTAYFAALRREMNGDGPAALLHFLQTFNLSEFDVRRVPQTPALLSQKLASARGFDLWWLDVLHDGRLGGLSDTDVARWESRSIEISCAELRADYEKWTRERRHENDPIGARLFGRKIHQAVPGLGKTQHGAGAGRWFYVLPPLKDCRATLEAAIGGPVDW